MSSNGMRKILADYEAYLVDVLRPTRDELKSFFRDLKDPSRWSKHMRRTRVPSPSPVQRAFPRIKRPESAVDKIIRKPESFPKGLCIESLQAMTDAVAGRIVVYFLANLPLVDREIRECDELEISDECPPVAYLDQDLVESLGLTHISRKTKDSGYASIHYIVRLRHSVVPAEQRPWFELQVRTLAEDIWGEIEHVLGYKPNKRTSFAVKKTFRIISSQLTAIDEHFNMLYEELSRFQEEGVYRDPDPLNAENLPPVLSELGLGCAQREVDGLLKLLASRGYESVGDLRDQGRRVELVRNVYRNAEGHSPTDFEVVAALAATRSLTDQEAITEAIRNHIEFLKAWEKLKNRTSRT